VQLLIDFNANRNIENRYNKKPIDLAISPALASMLCEEICL
jgi:hypothetical protein